MISETRRSICCGRVGHDLLLELPLDARAVHQVEHAADAQRLVEVAVPAALHLEQHVLDRRPCAARTRGQIGAILRQLPLDVVERRGVVREERQALVGDRRVAPRQRRRRRRAGSTA